MSITLHFYRGQATDHIAWTINGEYFSFAPARGRGSVPLGSVNTPFRGGEMVTKMSAQPSKNSTQQHDEATYTAAAPELIEIEGCDSDRAALFVQDLLADPLPYILWSPNDIGSINCVTSAIIIFTIMLPEDLPTLWDSKWGGIFERIRTIGSHKDADWVEHVIRNADPNLMYPDQVADMARSWIELEILPHGIEAGVLLKARPPIGDPISATPEPEGLWTPPPDGAG
jgi:hypothetical protein